MRYSIQHCGLLILAAGASTRLGQPKQLLEYRGKTMLNRLVDTTKAAGDFPTVLVLGARAEEIRKSLENDTIYIVLNEEWPEGMASSIRTGVDYIQRSFPHIDGLMIFVCDQPFVDAIHIRSLLKIQREKDLPIAACYYAGILGTPVLFHQSIFQDLLALKGDIGAKFILRQRENEVARLDFEKGVLDIDSIEDYQKLMGKEGES